MPAPLKLYNTRSRKLEEFSPINPPQVGLYTCGPTVYNTAHLGNLRTYIFEDVLRRTLEFNGYTVKHVMNITDVGHLTDDGDMGADKVEISAKRERKSAYAIAAFYTDEFFDDLKKLNIESPSSVLKATETIDLQIELIKKLEAKGMTYGTRDGLYFDTSKFPRYGQLSGQKAADKKAGARVEIITEKKNSTDFALWKFSRPEDQRQMEWPSPWGVGFPGWHIECSAMSMHELGEQFDIHTGGIDHIAVHHENEIAQSEAATGKSPFVKYWLHAEFLILQTAKMSKSVGNTLTVNELERRKIAPLAYRYFVLQAHYRSKLTFSWEALRAADSGLRQLWLLIDINGSAAGIGCAEFEQRFQQAVNDDLNTPKALAVLHEMINSDQPWSAKLQTLIVMDQVLGLGLTAHSQRPHFQSLGQAVFDEVKKLIEEREAARQKKDFKKSDQLRNQINAILKKVDYVLEDTPTGPQTVLSAKAALTNDQEDSTL